MKILSIGFYLMVMLGLLVYYTVPVSMQAWVLLCLSVFTVCSVSPTSMLIVLASALWAYYTARWAANENAAARKKLYAYLGVIGCMSILIILKYVFSLPFFAFLMPFCGSRMLFSTVIGKYIIPIGLSYFTLQLVSYILDVYWERIPAETKFWKILLFSCFFPQMLQGPISKYKELSEELFAPHDYRWKNIKYGVQLTLWGLFKKLVIADTFGSKYVVPIFFLGKQPTGLTILFGLVCFGIQLYCEFSGGIDVIRGVAQCFGITMKKNFAQPFFSRSLAEFWRRWHISLGEWMRDYVFYAVSVSQWMNTLKKKLKGICGRKTANRITMAIADIIVFILVGVWHGTSGRYFAWGLYNGLILAMSVLLADYYVSWKKALHIDSNHICWKGFTMLRTFAIVTVGWIFDCVASAKDAAVYCCVKMFDLSAGFSHIAQIQDRLVIPALVGLVFVLFVDVLHEKGISIRDELAKKPFIFQAIVWTLLLQLIVLFGRIGNTGGFMYADF